MKNSHLIADAIEQGLVSPSVEDAGGFPANLVDVPDKLAFATQQIANAVNRIADIAEKQQ